MENVVTGLVQDSFYKYYKQEVVKETILKLNKFLKNIINFTNYHKSIIITYIRQNLDYKKLWNKIIL